jgi:hypothetical protein
MYQVDALQEHNPPPGNHLKADSGAYVKFLESQHSSKNAGLGQVDYCNILRNVHSMAKIKFISKVVVNLTISPSRMPAQSDILP